MSDSFAAVLELSPGQRLLNLHDAGLATRIADERQRWRRAWDFFTARIENRIIERVLLKRMAWVIDDGVIVKVFYPVFPPDQNAEAVIEWLWE